MATTSAEFDQSLFHISNPLRTYQSAANKNNLQELIHCIKERKKFFLITGEDGCGKTTFIQRAICELGTKTRMVSVNRGDLNYEQLIDFIGNDLETGFSSETSFEKKLTRLKDLLQMWSLQHVVIFIDQSLNYQQKMLEDVFKLVDAKIYDSCFFHLCITGLPGLAKKLKKSGLPVSGLSDACLFQIEPLSEDEIIAYINFHLQNLKDQGKSLFSDDALKRIVYYSKGLPRLINRLCSLGLLTAKLEEKPTVSPAMIDEVLENSLLLGKECGYTSSPFKDSILRDEIALETLEPLAENALMEEQQIQNTEFRALQDNENSVQQIDSAKEFQSGSVRNVSYENPVTFSKNTVFISAFVMGIIFSALMMTGLYFFQQANQDGPVKQVAIAGVNQLQTKDKIKQQKIAALLKRAEQQFAKQQLMTPEKDNAWDSYQEILDLAPDHPKALAGIEKIKQTYVLWAKQEIQQENYQQAAYHYRKALEASPDDEDILQALRDIDQKQLSKQALKAPVAKIALTDDEKRRIEELFFQTRQQLADKKLMTPMEHSAWSTYKKILALDPDNPRAISGINEIKETYILWARHEIKKGNDEHAVFLFRKALKISPDDPEILSALANIQRTETLGLRESDSLSGGEFYKLLNDQKGIDELLNFAEQQIARKRLTKPAHDSAFTVYQAILDRFPSHEKALAGVKRIRDIYVGWARNEIKQGNHPHAEYLYSKALEVAPADPEIMSTLRSKLKKAKTGSIENKQHSE